MTASGIPCQSWTEQCPHRHTMNKTYPELNNAENYCRNPQNSGQRPWCFTTDRHKRWEYCDIPKCIPGIKKYCTVLSLNAYHIYRVISKSFLHGASVGLWLEQAPFTAEIVGSVLAPDWRHSWEKSQSKFFRNRGFFRVLRDVKNFFCKFFAGVRADLDPRSKSPNRYRPPIQIS
jgi:hypothetical protein